MSDPTPMSAEPMSADRLEEIRSVIEQALLAFVLADLVANVHTRWATGLGMGQDTAAGAWEAMAADIEEERTKD